MTTLLDTADTGLSAAVYSCDFGHIEIAFAQLLGEEIDTWRERYARATFLGANGAHGLVVESDEPGAVRVFLRRVNMTGKPIDVHAWALGLNASGLLVAVEDAGCTASAESVGQLTDALWLYYRRAVEDAVTTHHEEKRSPAANYDT